METSDRGSTIGPARASDADLTAATAAYEAAHAAWKQARDAYAAAVETGESPEGVPLSPLSLSNLRAHLLGCARDLDAAIAKRATIACALRPSPSAVAS